MSNAAKMTALTRTAATELVRVQLAQSGSKMRAYSDVALAIGASPGWVRKFVTGHREVKEPGWSVGWKIVEQYRRLCDRIEADTALRRRRADEMQRQINETLARAEGVAARVAPREAPATITGEARGP